MVEEDRILAVVNPGDADAWSCWLTRRLLLLLFDQIDKFLANTSNFMKQAPTGARRELIVFEREAAMAITAKAMSRTPATDVINMSASLADLAERLTISSLANKIRIELLGKRSGAAAGLISRAELQRILQMLQVEVARAGWVGTPAKPSSVLATEENGPKPVRH
jgi:hypothetical protein